MKTKSILLLLFISISYFSNAQFNTQLLPCTTPTITITGATEICQGSSVALCAGGGTNYKWSSGETTSCVTLPPPPMSFTIGVRVSNPPCYKDTTITIIVDTMPQVRVQGALLCHGDSTELHAIGGYTYLWNNGATTDSILGILDSTYYVTVSKGACTKDSFKVTVIRWCTGIPIISNQIIENLSSNPCSSTLNITFEAPSNLSTIQIMDITGRVLLTDHCTLTTDHFPIDVSSLSPGMYVLRINSGSGTEVKKFIKE